MKQSPLSRTDLIKIRDTNKSEQVRVLLREISRLHEVVRTLRTMVKRAETEIGNGYLDTLAFDRIEEMLEPEMRLYGPPPYDHKANRKFELRQAEQRLIEKALKREANVRKNQTVK